MAGFKDIFADAVASKSEITLRDYFAGKVMQAILADPDPSVSVDDVASLCYKFADAMIVARGSE